MVKSFHSVKSGDIEIVTTLGNRIEIWKDGLSILDLTITEALKLSNLIQEEIKEQREM